MTGMTASKEAQNISRRLRRCRRVPTGATGAREVRQVREVREARADVDLQRLMLLDALDDAGDGRLHRLQEHIREHAHAESPSPHSGPTMAHSRSDRSGMWRLCSSVTSP